MRSFAAILLVCFFSVLAGAQEPLPPPIIDTHVHALSIDGFEKLGGPRPIPHCVPMTDYPVPKSGAGWPEIFGSRDLPCRKIWSPTTDEDVMRKTLEIMKRRNVIGVTSGGRLDRWRQVAPDRLIPSMGFGGGPDAPPLEAMRKAFEDKRFAVLGEVTIQFAGMTPDDPSLASYWALAEDLRIPVGIHIGTGPVGAPYGRFERYRARLHSPLVLEDTLVEHRDLRVYIMHAGWPMLDDLLAVLWTHPHVRVEVGAISWALPRPEFHRYLRRIVEAGFGKRVMFGSDQMIWPDAMEMAIESIETADFLSAEQKRDIFFNNAASFLELSREQIASMQGRRP